MTAVGSTLTVTAIESAVPSVDKSTEAEPAPSTVIDAKVEAALTMAASPVDEKVAEVIVAAPEMAAIEAVTAPVNLIASKLSSLKAPLTVSAVKALETNNVSVSAPPSTVSY